MKKIKEEIYKYITDDGEVFYKEEDALEHKYEIIIKRLCENLKKIESCNMYSFYTINNREELEALNETYRQCDSSLIKFNIDDIKVFPVLICEETLDGWFSYFKTIDDLIMNHELIVEELKALKLEISGL